MKIAILTHPLDSNYGGILQNYALQIVLKRMGHEVITLDHVRYRLSFVVKVLSITKTILLRTFGKGNNRTNPWKRERLEIYARQNIIRFIDQHISRIQPVYGEKELRQAAESIKADAYIVGSDQVWRPCMVGCIEHYFLDFIKDFQVKRIAYAASFGVDEWEFTAKQTKRCAELATKFNAISTRELSGVNLCRKHLQVDAVNVSDPTLLLYHQDYKELIDTEQEAVSAGDLFVYLLDVNNEKKNFVHKIAKQKALKPFYSPFDIDDNLYNTNTLGHDPLIYPPVTRWLRAFLDARFVICDSFHGVVFSIIFNKPFVVFANEKRGNARFNTLLKKLGLEDRMINATDYSAVDRPIDWEVVNAKKELWREQSLEFLEKTLSKNV